MSSTIGERIMQLMDYLDLTTNEFSNQCNISNYVVIKRIIIGATVSPKHETYEKIIARYPVRKDWLYFDDGEMWETDYFKNRFEKRYKELKNETAAKKMQGLLEIFETNSASFGRKIEINRVMIGQIKNGEYDHFTKNIIAKIRNVYPFIPMDFL